MFAAGCAFGLFFGWLLHRERVERALYEDVVRTRDRATSTLAETSARLELANKDMVRLRGQLTNAQHLLDEREATIAELGDVGTAADVPGGDAGPAPGEPIDSAADAATTPDDVRLFDDDLDDEHDITEEVPLAAIAADGDSDPSIPHGDAVAPDEDDPIAGDAADEVVVDAPDAVAVDAPELVAEQEPPADVDVAEPAPVPEVDAQTPTARDTEPEAPDRDDAGSDIGTPLVLEPEPDGSGATATHGTPTPPDLAGHEGDPADVTTTAGSHQVPGPTPDQAGSPRDELQRISGIGPALERQLRSEGITTYRRLALLDEAAVADLEVRAPRLVAHMRRGGWIPQARRLHLERHGTQP